MTEENALEAKPAVLRATVTIVRANTGKVETYEIIGTPEPEEPKPDEEPK